MAERKTRKPRARRVTESGKAKSAKDSEITNPRKSDSPITREVPMGANGKPMIEFWVQSSETVPVAQYANVVVGPIGARMWIEDDGDEETLAEAIRSKQNLIEEIVGEDREIIFESVKFYNEMKEEEAKAKEKKGK